ncbi:hypothetical protein D3C76_1683370 [compost metagenome]
MRMILFQRILFLLTIWIQLRGYVIILLVSVTLVFILLEIYGFREASGIDGADFGMLSNKMVFLHRRRVIPCSL